MKALLGTVVSKVIEDLLSGTRRVGRTCDFHGHPTTVKGYWVGNLIRIDIQGGTIIGYGLKPPRVPN